MGDRLGGAMNIKEMQGLLVGNSLLNMGKKGD